MSHCEPPSCNCFVGRCYNNVKNVNNVNTVNNFSIVNNVNKLIFVTNSNNVKSACFEEMVDMVVDTEVSAEGLEEVVDRTVVEVMDFKKKKEVINKVFGSK